MKRNRTTHLRQTELFCEPEFHSILIPLPLAVSRETELKSAIAELLLNAALADAEAPKGDERDE
jgi:hypothetical protein